MEDSSPPASPTPVGFNEGGILDINTPCVFGFCTIHVEPRLIVSGADGDREPQGHHRETSDMSEWSIKSYCVLLRQKS